MKSEEAKEKEQVYKPKKKTSTIKILWNIIVKILMIIIIFISVIIMVQKITNNEMAFLGFRIFRVQTGSMIPKYQIGDVILVKYKNPEKIKIGDDVTYQGKDGSFKGLTVTHSVIDIKEVNGVKEFHTKGIANNLEDPIVYGEQINGVVQCKLQILTWICTLLNNKYIFYFGAVLPLTIYIFFKVLKGNYEKRFERD